MKELTFSSDFTSTSRDLEHEFSFCGSIEASATIFVLFFRVLEISHLKCTSTNTATFTHDFVRQGHVIMMQKEVLVLCVFELIDLENVKTTEQKLLLYNSFNNQ